MSINFLTKAKATRKVKKKLYALAKKILKI